MLKAQEEMKDKKMEIELSIISEETGNTHKLIDRATMNELTAKAQNEIEQEEMEMA